MSFITPPARRAVALGEHALHHQPRDHRPRVLVLAGDQIAVGDEVVGEEVARRMVLALVERAGLAQRRLRVERRDLDAELVDLLVGDGRETAALDEQLAVGARAPSAGPAGRGRCRR